MNILISSAGRRVSLIRAFQKELKISGLKGKVFTTDLNPALSAACQISDKAFKVRKISMEGSVNELLNICLENMVSLVVPTIDTELKILAENKELFREKGIEILVSDLDFVNSCRDKRKIHDFFDSLAITRALEFSKNDLRFPVFVKPYDGSRSQGVFLFENISEIPHEVFQNPKNMYLQYFNNKDYDEFTVDMYFNRKAKLICSVPRERIFVRDGEVNKGCTRKNEIVNYLKKKFDGISGLRGCITLQIFKHKTEDKYCAIEINPRFGGGFPLSYKAKANFPKWIIHEYLLGEQIDEYFDEWEDNLLMLRYDDEVLVHGYE
ncbi:carbamoyl-phosphate synthase large subunit [Lishizhenia tianjinensis]|uniref:Carbamoyl-phosphate synthase large subunit n=1 Tax=Lishizhenia tianjinensis TaxID=477690 RepID=A0A1I6ZK45_9FLAO|nr:ATP-grasp domain-containing protein [Lishizhenia tianjinensis]SFT63036.1 carbamoyl-phosphate synthase large subunit [Lishizhenia tianjinensis]